MRYAGTIIMACCLAFPAIAQEINAEDQPLEPICELSANWRVVANELNDMPGMIMQLNKRDASGQPDCKTTGIEPDLTLGGPDQALWFTNIFGDFLVMARSTGPVSSVVVQNLADKAIILDVVSNDSQPDSWGITYWEQREAGTADTCPQFAQYNEQGFNSAIAHEMRYDFATKSKLTSGKTSCEPAQ